MIKDIRTTGPRDLRTILSGKHILVVEDDPVVAVDYRFQLQAIGITQTLQPTIRRALAYLADHDVDAAIVDNQLPDGTCERVVAELMGRHIPFIVVSAIHLACAKPVGRRC
jgi:DNA-binding response OmpR family regulator